MYSPLSGILYATDSHSHKASNILYPLGNRTTHKVYPYLLRGVDIATVNQVWSTDITYLPVLKGHFYLVAVMDWFSRKVLSWQVSNTMDTAFCIEALDAALKRYQKPTIFRVLSSRRTPSHRRLSRLRYRSLWTDEDGVMTTFSLNGCGALLSTS